MSYSKEYIYRVEPIESYSVIRNCSGCGCKTIYNNTNNFRVNANGTKIDIWLIYQCEHCKHTFNLNIHRRINPSEIQPSIYDRYLQNDRVFSKEYGLNKSIFARNGAVIDEKNVEYEILIVDKQVEDDLEGDMVYKTNNLSQHTIRQEDLLQAGNYIRIENPFELKLRVDKIAADIMQISRTKVGKLVDTDMISVEEELHNHGWTIWIKKNFQ